jgi:hypothetical protein
LKRVSKSVTNILCNKQDLCLLLSSCLLACLGLGIVYSAFLSLDVVACHGRGSCRVGVPFIAFSSCLVLFCLVLPCPVWSGLGFFASISFHVLLLCLLLLLFLSLPPHLLSSSRIDGPGISFVLSYVVTLLPFSQPFPFAVYLSSIVISIIADQTHNGEPSSTSQCMIGIPPSPSPL